jgi:Mn-dependent DtxR family transcriptional regulator
VVAAALASMAACPGRWTHADAVPKGVGNQRAIDRLVLIELYQRAIDGITTTVRASVRTLAMSLPVGRESVRESLMRLATDGWIGLSEATDGPTAATWSIDPRGVFHREVSSSRSALGLAPNANPPLEVWRQRSDLSSTLHVVTDLASHDIFTPRALGPQAGYVYAQLHHSGNTTLASLSQTCGLNSPSAQTTLERLLSAGLVSRSGLQWTAASPEARDRAAQLHGTTGTLAARRRAYQLEQATWAYWLEELALTSKAGPLAVQRQRVVRLANGDTVGLAPYPRRTKHQGDWRRARERIESIMAA